MKNSNVNETTKAKKAIVNGNELANLVNQPVRLTKAQKLAKAKADKAKEAKEAKALQAKQKRKEAIKAAKIERAKANVKAKADRIIKLQAEIKEAKKLIPKVKGAKIDYSVASKAALKINATIESLKAKKETDGLTMTEYKRLINALYKVEDKTLSRVYKNLSKPTTDELAQLIKEMLGRSKFPTFKAFAEAMPNRYYYSIWNGLNVLAKFNKLNATKVKAAKQNKETAKALEIA